MRIDTVKQSDNARNHSQAVAVVVAIFLTLPHLVTPISPLVDFYAHVTRYWLLSGAAELENLRDNYEAAWAFLPNLGVDILGAALLSVVPPLFGAKMLSLLIVFLPFLGILALARVLHGSVHPITIALAGIIGYSHIFAWGFANFLLALGLGMLALAIWIYLEDRKLLRLLFASIAGIVLFMAHAFAFMLWGLAVAAYEFTQRSRGSPEQGRSLVFFLLSMATIAAIPVLLFLQFSVSSTDGGVYGFWDRVRGYFDAGELAGRLTLEVGLRMDSLLRVADSTFPNLDRLLGAGMWLSLLAALIIGTASIHPRMRLAIFVAAALIFVFPPNLFGVGHLGERFPMFAFILLVASLNWKVTGWNMWTIGLAGLLIIRIGLTVVSWNEHGDSYGKFLSAAEGLEKGGLAYSYSPPNHDQWNEVPRCAPLVQITAIAAHKGVPTFAYESQQPIRIVGPLAAALADVQGIEDDPAPVALERIGDAGFDTVVICGDLQIEVPPSFKPIASDRGWALYSVVQ